MAAVEGVNQDACGGLGGVDVVDDDVVRVGIEKVAPTLLEIVAASSRGKAAQAAFYLLDGDNADREVGWAEAVGPCVDAVVGGSPS